MPELQQFKCPCCDGAIEFDSSLQKMKCPFCDTEFEMETLQAYDAELNSQPQEDMSWNTDANTEWQEGETENLRIYTCQTCGGEVVADETTAASECPFCGNPVIMTGQFAGSLKPDLVIPFKVDKKAAIAALQNHYKGKPLLPKVFKDQNHIKEVKGLYVPVWLFDTAADAHVRYRASRIRSWSDSQYQYTETSYYSVTRAGGIAFENVPVDGSTKMDDALMESIEPYDFSKLTDFDTAYLSGYFADKYDVPSETGHDRVRQRVSSTMDSMVAPTLVGYATAIPTARNVAVTHGKARYVLLPVWMLYTKYEGKDYIFAMNGQTGKMTGTFPICAKRSWAWFGGIAGAVAALAGVIQLFML